MAQKATISVDADLKKRMLSRAENHKKTVEAHVAKTTGRRRQELGQIAALNAKKAAVLESEFTRVGIDLKKISAVCLSNAGELRKEMERFRKSRTSPSISRRPHSPRSPGYGLIPSPANFQNVLRTPPFDLQDSQINPPPPELPSTIAIVSADSESGTMNFFLDTPISSPDPSNVVATAIVGVVFFPTFGPVLSPFDGIANVQMTAPLDMIGSASCNFFGGAHSEGSVGWIVAEVSGTTGEITQVVDQNYAEQYYIDVGNGGSGQHSGPPNLTSQTTFWTNPECLYEIYVWLWGNITAAGAQGWWASQAAGFATVNVQTININWAPLFF